MVEGVHRDRTLDATGTVAATATSASPSRPARLPVFTQRSAVSSTTPMPGHRPTPPPPHEPPKTSTEINHDTEMASTPRPDLPTMPSQPGQPGLVTNNQGRLGSFIHNDDAVGAARPYLAVKSGRLMTKLRCPKCTIVVETDGPEAVCQCGQRLRVPAATTSSSPGAEPRSSSSSRTDPGAGRSTSAASTGRQQCSIFTWAAKGDGSYMQAGGGTVLFGPPLMVTAAAVAGVFTSTFRDFGNIKRQSIAERDATPIWTQRQKGTLEWSSNGLTVETKSGRIVIPWSDVFVFAPHPKERLGVVIASERLGYRRIKCDSREGDAALLSVLRLHVPDTENTWTPSPIPEPMARLAFFVFRVTGLLSLLSALVFLALYLLTPAGLGFVVRGFLTLWRCWRQPDSFKLGLRGYMLFVIGLAWIPILLIWAATA